MRLDPGGWEIDSAPVRPQSRKRHEPALGQPGAGGLEPARGHEQRGSRPCLVVIDPAVNGSQRIRRCYGQVSEAELAAIDAGLRLYLGLEPDPD